MHWLQQLRFLLEQLGLALVCFVNRPVVRTPPPHTHTCLFVTRRKCRKHPALLGHFSSKTIPRHQPDEVICHGTEVFGCGGAWHNHQRRVPESRLCAPSAAVEEVHRQHHLVVRWHIIQLKGHLQSKQQCACVRVCRCMPTILCLSVLVCVWLCLFLAVSLSPPPSASHMHALSL